MQLPLMAWKCKSLKLVVLDQKESALAAAQAGQDQHAPNDAPGWTLCECWTQPNWIAAQGAFLCL